MSNSKMRQCMQYCFLTAGILIFLVFANASFLFFQDAESGDETDLAVAAAGFAIGAGLCFIAAALCARDGEP